MNLKIKFVSITRNVTKRFNYIVSGGDFLDETLLFSSRNKG